MVKFSDFYYKIFENVQVINNKGGVPDKIVNKFMLLYKSFTNFVNAKDIKKRAKNGYDEKYAKLHKFKNLHKGKRCFIICTGPSLTLDDINMLKGEYTFGLNSITKLFDKTDWRPSYYVISDAAVYNSLRNDEAFKNIKRKFIANDIAKVEKTGDKDVVYYVDGYDCFKFGHAVKFSDNAYVKVFAGGTVTYDAMQLAAYMGFNEVYLLGCDSDYSGAQKHFSEYWSDNSKLKDLNFSVSQLFESYKTAQKYCEIHELKIYNATRGGKLEVFPRVDFDSLFDEKDDKKNC